MYHAAGNIRKTRTESIYTAHDPKDTPVDARTNETHEHPSAYVCVQQFERTINGKSFLFTAVNLQTGAYQYRVDEKVDGVVVTRHKLMGLR